MKEIKAQLERLWAAYCLGLAPRVVVAPTEQAPAPAEVPAQKEIEAHLERVWVAYCSRCTNETLLYRDLIDEAAQELVNSGWRWYERSKRLLCPMCERERKH